MHLRQTAVQYWYISHTPFIDLTSFIGANDQRPRLFHSCHAFVTETNRQMFICLIVVVCEVMFILR